MIISIKDAIYVDSPSRGNQIKFKDKDTNKWYKVDFFGYEAAAEFATTDILRQSNITYPYVEYDIKRINIESRTGLKKVNCCISKNFLQSGDSVMTLHNLFEKMEGRTPAEALKGLSIQDKIKYTVNLVEDSTGINDFGKYLTTLLELDAFIYNEDRHFNNIAVIEDKSGCFRPCPIFDNGAAFLSDIREYAGEKIGILRKAVRSKPFDDNFTKQVDACRELFGSQLMFYKSLDLSKKVRERIKDLYGDAILDRIDNTVKFSKNMHPEMISRVSCINKNISLDEMENTLQNDTEKEY